MSEQILYIPEPITTDALEADGIFKMGSYGDNYAEYSNGNILVEFIFSPAQVNVHVFADDNESGYCAFAKGVNSLQKLRLLNELMNG